MTTAFQAKVQALARKFIQAGRPKAPKISELGLLDWVGGLFVSLAFTVYVYFFTGLSFSGAHRILSLVKSLASR